MINRFIGEYRFLSNFWPVRIVDDMGLEYGSVETAYQASKSDEIEVRQLFVKLHSAQARQTGRHIQIRSNSDQIKLDILHSLVRQKFSEPTLRRFLAETCGHELVEGNVWGDTFWGMCHGVGANWLGRILMEVREENRRLREK